MDGSGGNSTSNGSNSITRWNPTKEQVGVLEGLYARGMRTPTAEQIQGITSQLRAYGHIEGKNVFYWFQNHKARQRQKEKELQQQQGCLNFSYLNRHCLYFHDRNAAAAPVPVPGLLYHPVPSPSSTNVVFRPNYGTSNGTPRVHFSPANARTMTPTTETYPLESYEKSTLDLFPVHPTGIVDQQHDQITKSSPHQDIYSDYNVESYVGDLRDRPFFDFLSVNR